MVPPFPNDRLAIPEQSLAPSGGLPSSTGSRVHLRTEVVRANLVSLLGEPEVKLAMLADGVDENELLAMLSAISTKFLQGSLHFDNTKNIKYRPGVGIVLLNSRGQVLVGRRIDIVEPAWQLPQGGIERGEYPSDAALRELKEELGTSDVEIIAESKGWLTYDVPSEHTQKAWNGQWQGQRQKWFVMRYKGSDADFDLGSNQPEFSDWQWIPLRELPALAVHFKRELYRNIITEFQATLSD